MAGRQPERPDLTAAVQLGRLEGLVALRDVLAQQIAEAQPQYVAALAARLADVLEQLDALAPAEEPKGTPLDDLARKRAARGAGTARQVRP